MEHETQTRMFNGIQISNLKTPIKISLHWVKALGYNTENHPVWLPSKCITNQAHNLSFHKNSTRIDFNYHLILISLSCQKKKFHTREIESWQPELIYGILRTIDLPVTFLVFSLLLEGCLRVQII